MYSQLNLPTTIFCKSRMFFDEFPNGIEGRGQKPISQKIFEAKLEIADLISEAPSKSKEDEALAEQYINELHKAIATLNIMDIGWARIAFPHQSKDKVAQE